MAKKLEPPRNGAAFNVTVNDSSSSPNFLFSGFLPGMQIVFKSAGNLPFYVFTDRLHGQKYKLFAESDNPYKADGNTLTIVSFPSDGIYCLSTDGTMHLVVAKPNDGEIRVGSGLGGGHDKK